MRHQSHGAGLTLAVLSAATFGTSGIFGTSLIHAGWTPGAAVTARIVTAAVVLTVPALIHLRGRWHVLRRDLATVAAYGVVAVAGCQLFFFNAVSHLSVGVALLLEYLGTFLVVAWLWLRHGHRPRRLTIAGGGFAVAGLVLVLDLAGSHRLDPVGLAWGLSAAAGLAVYFLLSAGAVENSSSSADSDGSDGCDVPVEPLPPLVLAWGGMCVAAVGLVAFGAAGLVPMRVHLTDVRLADHRVSWVVPVLGLSLLAAAFAYVAGIGAARLLGAKVASFVGLTEVLFAVVFAWMALGQTPTGMQLLGGALIVTGVVLVRVDELGHHPVSRLSPAASASSDPDRVPAGHRE